MNDKETFYNKLIREFDWYPFELRELENFCGGEITEAKLKEVNNGIMRCS